MVRPNAFAVFFPHRPSRRGGTARERGSGPLVCSQEAWGRHCNWHRRSGMARGSLIELNYWRGPRRVGNLRFCAPRFDWVRLPRLALALSRI
jgi:hypothetical protein